MQGKEEEQGGSAMKKACQHYLFYWFNSKGLPLKLYVALAGSIENTTAANKKRFPKKKQKKKLEHLFFFPCFIFISCLPTQILHAVSLRFHTFHHLYEKPLCWDYVQLCSPSQRYQCHWGQKCLQQDNNCLLYMQSH